MRYLEDLNIDKLKGKEFWIVGLGPSLDDYPDNFFEGKIAIGLNTAFVAFPHLTYFLTGDQGPLPGFMIETAPGLVKRTIWVLDQEPSLKYIDHPRIPAPDTEFGEYKDDLIYTTRKVISPALVEVFKKALPPIIEDVMQRKQPWHLILLRTCAHYAILCAAYLGAKEITLVGCEAKSTEHSFHAQKRGLHDAHAKMQPGQKENGTAEKTYSIEYQTGTMDHLISFRVGTELLAEALAPYGVVVRKYYYGKGYEDIIQKNEGKT